MFSWQLHVDDGFNVQLFELLYDAVSLHEICRRSCHCKNVISHPAGEDAFNGLLVCAPARRTLIAAVSPSAGQKTDDLGRHGLHQALPGLGI